MSSARRHRVPRCQPLAPRPLNRRRLGRLDPAAARGARRIQSPVIAPLGRWLGSNAISRATSHARNGQQHFGLGGLPSGRRRRAGEVRARPQHAARPDRALRPSSSRHRSARGQARGDRGARGARSWSRNAPAAGSSSRPSSLSVPSTTSPIAQARIELVELANDARALGELRAGRSRSGRQPVLCEVRVERLSQILESGAFVADSGDRELRTSDPACRSTNRSDALRSSAGRVHARLQRVPVPRLRRAQRRRIRTRSSCRSCLVQGFTPIEGGRDRELAAPRKWGQVPAGVLHRARAQTACAHFGRGSQAGHDRGLPSSALGETTQTPMDPRLKRRFCRKRPHGQPPGAESPG